MELPDTQAVAAAANSDAEFKLAARLWNVSSIGGNLATDLAMEHAGEFRAIIGLEAAALTPGGYDDQWSHPRVSNDYKASVMYGLMSPTSPEKYRRETAWIYSQGAPPVFKGDLYYYSIDHDLTQTAERIDATRTPLYLLTGGYDWASTPAMSEELASRIKGGEVPHHDGTRPFSDERGSAALPRLHRAGAGGDSRRIALAARLGRCIAISRHRDRLDARLTRSYLSLSLRGKFRMRDTFANRLGTNCALILAICAAVTASACAHLTFESATVQREPWYKRWVAHPDGIHYYRPKPYLLVTETTGATSSCVVDIKYLPDYSQEYVIIPRYWFGSVALKPTLTDGWNLTSFDSTVDTKIPETLNALAAMLKSVAPSGLAVAPPSEAPTGNVRPGLYPMEPAGDRLTMDTEHPVFEAKGSFCKTLTAPPAPTRPPIGPVQPPAP